MENLSLDTVSYLDKYGYITKAKTDRNLLWSWFVVESSSCKMCLKFLERAINSSKKLLI